MKTRELIGYLRSLRDYKDELAWELRGKIDRKIVLDEIIKRLEELEEFKGIIEFAKVMKINLIKE